MLNQTRVLGANTVRNHRRLQPMWEPSMSVPPEILTTQSHKESGYKLLSFFAADGKPRNNNPSILSNETKQVMETLARLLFTGNRPELEKDASGIFELFQKDCPMKFESTRYNSTGKKGKNPWRSPAHFFLRRGLHMSCRKRDSDWWEAQRCDLALDSRTFQCETRSRVRKTALPEERTTAIVCTKSLCRNHRMARRQPRQGKDLNLLYETKRERCNFVDVPTDSLQKKPLRCVMFGCRHRHDLSEITRHMWRWRRPGRCKKHLGRQIRRILDSTGRNETFENSINRKPS